MFQTNCLCTTVPRCTKYIQVSQHPRHLSVAGLFVARVSVSVCAERVVVRNLASFAGLAMFSISLFCHIPIIPNPFPTFHPTTKIPLRIRLDSRSLHASADSGSKCVSLSAWAPANNETAGGPIEFFFQNLPEPSRQFQNCWELMGTLCADGLLWQLLLDLRFL